MSWNEWAPRLTVGSRRVKAGQWVARQKKKGVALSPVVIEGRKIASSFWGKAWCDSLESYGDYANRLPRGRSYVRSGSVVHLAIEAGAARARVSGSRLYDTCVTVEPLGPRKWKALVDRHATQVGSVIEILQGRLPKSLLEAIADPASGLFPRPKELAFDCSCPDYASMCKHVAAVLYGVGARLDAQPELFFVLRGVEVTDLAARGAAANFGTGAGDGDLAEGDLGELFGIELAASAAVASDAPQRRARGAARTRVAAKASGKKAATATATAPAPARKKEVVAAPPAKTQRTRRGKGAPPERGRAIRD